MSKTSIFQFTDFQCIRKSPLTCVYLPKDEETWCDDIQARGEVVPAAKFIQQNERVSKKGVKLEIKLNFDFLASFIYYVIITTQLYLSVVVP